MVVGSVQTRRIFPVTWNAKAPPLVAEWEPFMYRDPTDDEFAEWNRFTNCNWAMVTGAASGLVVLDVDLRRGGDESIKRHAVPITYTVRTPSGGTHYYFRFPNTTVPSVKDFEPGLEVRADRVYVLIPPSKIDGVAYEIVCEADPVPLPTWAIEAARRCEVLEAAKTIWKDALGQVPPGRQDDHLIALAGKLARCLPVELWPTIPASLAAVARSYPQDLRKPWTAKDFQRLARSACQMEQKRRTSIPVWEVPL